MKVAILTQPLGHNYGGIMQAYALQKVISQKGHQVTIVNRQKDKPSIFKRLAIASKLRLKKFIKKDSVKSFSEADKKTILSNMNDFICEYMNRSSPIYSSRKLIEHFNAQNYDILVVGSDQVWRPSYSANIYNYFFDFKEKLNNKVPAITYAASLGVDNWEYNNHQTRKCSNYISNFSAVSVRESSAVELCNLKFNISPELVLDPTLLLDSKEYLNLSASSNLEIENGLLFYILDENKNKLQLINKVASALKLKPFSCLPKRDLENDKNLEISEYCYPSPNDWIKSFAEAQFVITDSYHGCIFSIIFKKPFFVIANKKRGNSRFLSLLRLLNLEDRLIYEGDISYLTQEAYSIDWTRVNQKLETERNKSIEFINTWL